VTKKTYPVLIRIIAGLLLTAGLSAGCSGIKTYPNTLDKNVHVRTETESGSMFSSVRAAVDIYRVDAACGVEYEGTVQLDEASVDIGIPPGRENKLVFVLASSTFLAGKSGQISYDTLLATRDGYDYDVRVRYLDDIYNVTIHETQIGGTDSREIPPRRLTCTPHQEPSLDRK